MLDHLVDHPLQAHALAVFRRIDPADPVGVQLTQLLGHNHPAAATEYLDVFAAARFQQVDHVFEKLDVAALVGGDGNALNIFLQGGIDNFLHRAVMTEMDNFHSGGLENAAHDVDGGIVAVKERGRGNKTNFVSGLVQRFLTGRGWVHHGSPCISFFK